MPNELYESKDQGSASSSGGRVPIPDPTLLTTVQLNREISAVKDLIHALKEIVFTRLDGMDKALELSNHNLSRVPTEVERQVFHLKEVQNERFRSIEIQFGERDARAVQSETDSRIRVEAAFASAEKAVSEQNKSFVQATQKTEATVTKQIEQIMTMIQSAKESRDDAIGALKDRLTLIEGKGYGQHVAQAGQQVSSNYTLAIVVALISFVGLLVVIFNVMTGKG